MYKESYTFTYVFRYFRFQVDEDNLEHCKLIRRKHPTDKSLLLLLVNIIWIFSCPQISVI